MTYPVITSPAIDAYCVRHTTTLPSLFDELSHVTRERTTAPQMQVGQLEGSFLRMLVALTGAKTILEFGTFTGYSAMAMAAALPEGGKLITCDIDPKATSIAKEFWARSSTGHRIELKLAPGLETIAKLDVEFDLVFIDADKGNYINYWEAALPKMRKGGLAIVDNVLWDGKVIEPREESDRKIAAFNTHARQDTRVEIVMLPVRDGILLARKL